MATVEHLADTWPTGGAPLCADGGDTPFLPVTEEILAEITRRIVEAVHPQKIVLFGSFAGGTPDADSDVDLLIVVESDLRPAERAIAVERLLWPRPFPIDVLVRTPAEIEAALRAGDHFLSSVLRHGWTLYARSE